MPRKSKTPTAIPNFGFIFQPTYTYRGQKKKSRVWHMEYNAADGKVRESTHTKDQAEAFAELMKKAGGRASGHIGDVKPERALIGELLDLLVEDYKRQNRATLYDLEVRVAKLRAEFGAMKAIELRPRHLKAFGAKMMKAGSRPSTVNRYYANLHRAYVLGKKSDPVMVLHVPEFPWEREGNNARQGIITDEVYQSLRRELAPHAALAFVIGYHTGLRRSAILELRWDWVDLDAGVIRIPSSDTSTKRKPKVAPIYGDDMREMLRMARDMRRPACPYVIQYDGQRVHDIKTAWHAAIRRLGLPKLLFHDLRRTAATNMDAAGISRSRIKQLCGWKTDAMFERYQIGTEQQVVADARMIEAHLAAKREKEERKGAVQ